MLLFAIVNCKQEKKNTSNFEFYPPFPDSTGGKKLFFDWRTAETEQFNLATLFSGTNDSLVIRFWPSFAFEPFKNMFEFRLDSNGWKAYHYCSYTLPNQDGKIIHRYGQVNLGGSVFLVKQVIPKCGWDKFSDSLNFFQLRSLPTQELIKDYKFRPILDGGGYSFEIATQNSYRNIHYANPDVYPYKESQQVIELVSMIIRQLGDDYYWPLNPSN